MNKQDAEREALQEKLRQSEAVNRVITQSACIGIWDLNLQTQDCIMSAPMAEMLGIPSEKSDFSQLEWQSRIQPEDRSLFQATFGALKELQTMARLELRVQWEDGSLHYLSVCGEVFKDTQGALHVYGATIDITERKLAEESLQATKARLTLELAAMNYLHNLSVRLLSTYDQQAALEEVLDASLALLDSDMGYIQLYHPNRKTLDIVVHRGIDEDLLQYFTGIKEDSLLASGKAMRQRQRVIIEDVQTDPEYEPFRHLAALAGYRCVQSTPLLDGKDQLLGMLITHRRVPSRPTERQLHILDLYAGHASDFIQRIRMEEALRESEVRFRHALQSENVGIVFFNLQGGITDCNDAFLQMSGYRRKDVMAQRLRWDEMTPPEWKEKSLQALDEFKARGYTTPYAKESLRRDGSRWWALLAATRLGDNEGVEYVLDITQQKHTEQALRASEARFRTLAEASPALIWQIDPHGNPVYLNQRYLKQTGMTPVQLQQSGWHAIIHPEDVAGYIDSLKHALHEQTRFQKRVRIQGRDGNWYWYESYALPLLDESGRYGGHVGMSIDIDAAVQAEQALKQSSHRKDEFLATLAHELRNPLAPISNAMHLLKHQGGKRAADQLTDMVERQVSHIVRLVDDLLEVSRITSGKINLHKAPVAVAELVRTAIETSRPFIDSARHQLTVSLPVEPLVLDGDIVRLNQILVNLLNNAAKYTEAGGNIWLTAAREGGQVVLSVRDSGIGIPADTLPHVFEIFAQGSGWAHRGQGGFGIGLTMVHGLVDLHGGSVEAQSDGSGQGSNFIVRLPLLETERAGPEKAAEFQTDAGAPLSGQRILVVDDNHDAADTLAMLLTVEGANVQVVYDGQAALAAVESYQPDVVLLDIGMPGMDGYEVAQRIRQQVQFQRIRLIALTGWGQEADRLQSRASGFDQHFTKPVDINALRTLLTGP